MVYYTWKPLVLFICLLYIRVDALTNEDVNNLLTQAAQHYGRNDFTQALELYKKISAILPDNPQVAFNMGLCYSRMNDIQNAHALFEKTIQLDPNYVVGYSSLGSLLSGIGNHQAAYEVYKRGLSVNPRDPMLLYNAGLILHHLRRLPESIEYYRRLLEVEPDNMRGLNNMGVSYMTNQQFEEATTKFLRAYELGKHPLSFFNYMMCKNRIANWTDWEGASAHVAEIMQGHPDDVGVSPFNCLEFQRLPIHQCPVQSRAYGLDLIKSLTRVQPFWNSQTRRSLMKQYRIRTGDRLRVAYIHSTGFVESTTTARMLQSVFQHHDRSKFHIHCFALDSRDDSSTRRTIAEECETFIDLAGRPMDMAHVAQEIFNHNIHIALDLSGYTINPKTGVFYLRPAPIQVNFHGYPGTLALDFIDYIVVDRDTAPPEASSLYTEKLVYMPHTYLANSKAHVYPEILEPLPANITAPMFGLPEGKVIYASFHQFYKITPDLFDTWMNILKRVPNSVLWIIVFAPQGVNNLKAEARRRGVDPARLVFTDRIAREYEYHVKKFADIFLDTPIFNGHTTGTDVLWSGVPIVTRPGSLSFQSRVASGLLRSLNVPELVVQSEQEYEELAVRLGTDQAFYQEVRSKVERNRQTQYSPLFDTARWTRNFEAVLSEMWEVYSVNGDGISPRSAHIISSDVGRED